MFSFAIVFTHFLFLFFISSTATNTTISNTLIMFLFADIAESSKFLPVKFRMTPFKYAIPKSVKIRGIVIAYCLAKE